jgi:ligand-binding SRPBCC domain-containing protein
MKFVKESVINALPEKVFDFHRRPDAFDLLVPPWESVRIVQRADITRVGSQAIIEQKIFGLFPSRWIAEHTKYDPPHMFEDVQVSGPFASWRHQHFIQAHEHVRTLLRDEIEYEPPFWIFGQLAAPFAIVPKLEKMFEYRHKITKEYCEKENDAYPHCLLEI